MRLAREVSSQKLPGVKNRGLFIRNVSNFTEVGSLTFPSPRRQGGTERKHSHQDFTEKETEAH